MLWDFQIGFFSSSAGAFFTYAIFIALFGMSASQISKRRKLKNYSALQAEKHRLAEEAVNNSAEAEQSDACAAKTDNLNGTPRAFGSGTLNDSAAGELKKEA